MATVVYVAAWNKQAINIMIGTVQYFLCIGCLESINKIELIIIELYYIYKKLITFHIVTVIPYNISHIEPLSITPPSTLRN